MSFQAGQKILSFILSVFGDSGIAAQKFEGFSRNFCRQQQQLPTGFGLSSFSHEKMEPYPFEIRVGNNVFFGQKIVPGDQWERDIPTVFWVTTIVMALLAFSFVATPFIRNNHRFGPLGIAIALPIFAAGLYWFVGSPQAANYEAPARPPMQGKTNAASSTARSVDSVASMVDGLAERLKQNPDDSKSWLLLARSYKHLQRMPEALEAYENAVALGEYDDDLATMPGALTSADSATAQIFGNLKLSERSQDIVLPTDTVFIFARAVAGPPMPVAVLQRPVSDLPLDFLLSDSQAMSADAKLSNYEQVIVTARISRSGVASDALQGLEAKSEVITVAENPQLNLTIE